MCFSIYLSELSLPVMGVILLDVMLWCYWVRLRGFQSFYFIYFTSARTELKSLKITSLGFLLIGIAYSTNGLFISSLVRNNPPSLNFRVKGTYILKSSGTPS